MYIPEDFRETRTPVLHELIEAHPLGLLVTGGAGGLMASPIPFLLERSEGGYGTLRAHMAKANPHWREVAGLPECLVVFQGPQGYITPSWYRTKAETHKVVPTWNYATVHAWGAPSVIDDAAWLARQLRGLTDAQERERPEPWSIDDAPPDYIAAQMRAIIGIEIPIQRIEGKWKMSQNRNEADRAGVIAGLSDPADPHANVMLALRALVRRPVFAIWGWDMRLLARIGDRIAPLIAEAELPDTSEARVWSATLCGYAFANRASIEQEADRTPLRTLELLDRLLAQETGAEAREQIVAARARIA